MKNRIVIMPYKMGSRGSKDLKDRIRSFGFNAIQVYPDRNYRPLPTDFIVNWGASYIPQWGNIFDVNNPLAVKNSIDKKIAFKILLQNGVSVPQFTERRDIAMLWGKCYARTTLTGCQGQGIVISKRGQIPAQAPLYVQGIEATTEYRVHVFNGQVLDYVKKLSDQEIRNHEHGAIFARNITRLERVENEAIKAVNALGLHFGAVDIVMDSNGKPYVLEVNTACGMEGATISLYANKIIDTAFGIEDRS